MSFISQLANKYKVVGSRIECPHCHKDLTEDGSVIRSDDKGGDRYTHGYYVGKFGDYETTDRGYRSYNYVDNCVNCDEELQAG